MTESSVANAAGVAGSSGHFRRGPQMSKIHQLAGDGICETGGRLFLHRLCFVIPVLSCVWLAGCQDDASLSAPSASKSPEGSEAGAKQVAYKSQDDPEYAHIKAFCGNCHAFPQPSSFPKAMWYEEVRRGFNFYYESGRSDLHPPAQSEVVAWFRHFAPEQLAKPDQSAASESPLKFRTTDLWLPKGTTAGATAVSFVDARRSGNSGSQLDIFVSDMKFGAAVQLAEVSGYAAESKAVPALRYSLAGIAAHPAVVRETDLDANGINDFLVTDLGSFLPEDNDRGKVTWIPDGASEHSGKPEMLISGIGRVADVQTGDFDGDGRSDVVVGSFGWHRTGGISLLRNLAGPDGRPQFERTELDPRPGTIHVIPHDLDGDGRLDLIALISQEFERIIAFMNRPAGFEKVSLYEAPDPSWGSSGMHLADMDGDGDQDLLYTNGDSFDSYLIKPYHGIRILENTGTLPWKEHLVAAIPGVHRALPADLDGDGDLDIAAAAMLPESTIQSSDPETLQAVIWMERMPDSTWRRHVVEHGAPRYAAMAVADLNQDNRPDLITGLFRNSDAAESAIARIYWNSSP